MAEDIKNEEASNSLDEQNNKENQTNHSLNKANLIKKALIAGIAILVIFLLIILVLILTKKPNSVEEAPSAQVASQIEQNIETVENKQLNENQTVQNEESDFKFDFNNLEPDKLNEQLELLTNKNLEYQKEKEQKILEEEKKLSPVFNLVNNLKDKEEIKKEENSIVSSEDNKKEEISKIEEIKEDKKEEIISEKKDIATSTNNETKTQNETSNINSNSKKEETTKITESLTFVKLINVAKIKGDLNKKYFDKVIEVNANVLLCRDDENIIELYYGPFLEDEIRDNLLSKLIKNGFKEAYSLEMTKEEFDKRCNY